MNILNEEFFSFMRCADKAKLRYLLIGGYAVNYHGYSRHTADLDIWVAPDNLNRDNFIQTLLCMKYTEQEVSPLKEEDFSQAFVGSIGSAEAVIDILTFVHKSINFDEAEIAKDEFEIEPGLMIPIVSYPFLKEIKLKSMREKDLFDVARLEEIKNK